MPALTINMQTMINGTVPFTFTPIILKVLCFAENPQSLADWILLNSYYQLQLDLDGYPQPWDLARAVPTLSGPQGYFSIAFWAEGGASDSQLILFDPLLSISLELFLYAHHWGSNLLPVTANPAAYGS